MSQMYYIVKDVASLTKNHRFHNGPHISKQKGSTRLNSFVCHVQNLCGIAPKYTGNINVRGWCSDKKGGIFLSVDPFKEKNQINIGPFI